MLFNFKMWYIFNFHPVLYLRNMSECCTALSLVPRVAATVGGVVITIFWQCDCYTIHLYVFWDPDSESDIGNFELKK